MAFRLDPDLRIRSRVCDHCAKEWLDVIGFIYRNDHPYAAFKAACSPHEPEVFVEVALGSEIGEEDADRADHVVFACRIGPVAGQDEPACTAIEAGYLFAESPIWGRMLDRESALAHPWIDAFWEVVDFILEYEGTVRHHVYHRADAG